MRPAIRASQRAQGTQIQSRRQGPEDNSMAGISVYQMTEAELFAQVTSLCEQRRVSLVHNDAPHHSKRRQNLIGFPDLFLCGAHRIAFRELKKQYGRSSPEQTTWKYRLLAAGQDYDIWRPKDLESGRIERELDLLCSVTRRA
jgi:hypothetical protein